jgi:acyl-CoA thioester hydrolase
MEFDLSSLPITNHKVIPKEYMDIMGHMNVMWYIHLFDDGTRNFFRSFGFGEDYVRRTGMGSFALESHVRYRAEVKVGEAVTVRSRVLARSAKTIHFMHFMTRDHDGMLAATIETLSAHADLSRRKVVPYPPEILGQLDPLLNVHQQLPWEAPVCGFIGVRKK